MAQTNQYLPGGQTGNKTTVISQDQISSPAGTISLKSPTAGNHGGGTVTVTLLPGTGYRVGSASTVTFEIDDTPSGTITSFSSTPPPSVSIDIAGSGAEGDPVTFGISVDSLKPLREPLPVNVTISGTGGILNASDVGWRTVTIPETGSLTLDVQTVDDNVPDNNTVTLTINPGPGYTLGQFSIWTVDIQDDDAGTQEQQAPPPLESSRAERQTAVAIDPVLVANVTAMASQAHHGHEHADRWTRVLAALGGADHSSPMTAAEARANAGTYSSPLWPLVADALELLEAEAADGAQQQQDPPQQDPPQQTPPQIDPALISGVRELASRAHHGHDHVDRWTRVLAALGEADHSNPMTAAEARANSERYSSPLWPQIADVLAARE